jgi:RecA-family ATPase
MADSNEPFDTMPEPDLASLSPEPSEDYLNAHDPDRKAESLRALLSVTAWAEMDIPEPDRLLGDLLTTTTRAFLVGRTGLGKTLLALAIAAGAASGTGFLHWRSSRPARVLYSMEKCRPS